MGVLALMQYVYIELLMLVPFPEGSFNRFTFFITVFLPQYILAIVATNFFFSKEQAGLLAGMMLALPYFAAIFVFSLFEDILRTLFNASYGIAVIDSTLGSWPTALIIVIYSMYLGWRRA